MRGKLSMRPFLLSSRADVAADLYPNRYRDLDDSDVVMQVWGSISMALWDDKHRFDQDASLR